MPTSKGNRQQRLSDNPATTPDIVTQPTLDTSRPGSPKPAVKLIKIDEVLERYPISRSKLYEMIAERKFPKQVHPARGQGAFWVDSEVDEWIQSEIEAERRAA